MTRAGLLLLLATPLFCQGTEPRKSAAEYPVQASLPEVSFGAEYLVRSVSARSRTFFIPDYLVVEVAVFPAAGKTATLSHREFTLHINKKDTLYPQSAGFVAASLKYPDWERRRQFEAVAGAGDSAVILGRPPAVGRFPGDPRDSRNRLPPAPKAPASDESHPRPEAVRADEAVEETILAQGEIRRPRSGYLYFPYKGKTTSLRSLELVYHGPAGQTRLKLR